MTKTIKNTRRIAFINRTKELQFLSERIHDEPNDILFIYGPKSSGKTTLLTKFIELNLSDKHYNIKQFNLREVLISNYTDFIQAFFEVDYSKSSQEIKQKSEYSLKVFKLSKEIKQSLENKILDPFVVMKKELQKIVKKGKRPVIIIDELQALEDIYMNGQQELLKELFNFFVAMTKESHLCHVIIASSDGYFMKRIYEDSKLTKTSDFFEVDYLNESDTKYWLNHLERESAITQFKLSELQIELIWKYLGGSMWEISNLLGKVMTCSKKNELSDEVLNNIIQKMIHKNYARFNHYAGICTNKNLLLKEIYKVSVQNNHFKIIDLKSLAAKKVYDNKTLLEALNKLVQLNYLAFNPTTSTYQLQGKSMFYGLKHFVENMPDDLF